MQKPNENNGLLFLFQSDPIISNSDTIVVFSAFKLFEIIDRPNTRYLLNLFDNRFYLLQELFLFNLLEIWGKSFLNSTVTLSPRLS